jgi:hypothetical protein
MAAPILVAQSPNFSGKWTLDQAKTAAIQPSSGQFSGSPIIAIAMDARTMTVVSIHPAGKTTNVYNLDGTPSSNTSGHSQNGLSPTPLVSRARWDGPVLVITTRLYDSNAVIRYSRDGESLKVEFANGQGPKAAFYKKSQ